MDRGQAFDVVGTPPTDKRDWPSLEDFQEPEETLRWRDIKVGTYKVLALYNQGRNKYGPSVMLKLESESGSTFKCGRRLRCFMQWKKEKKQTSS